MKQTLSRRCWVVMPFSPEQLFNCLAPIPQYWEIICSVLGRAKASQSTFSQEFRQVSDVTDLGWEAVRNQGSDSPIKKVRSDEQLKGFETPAILNQLEKLGIDVSAHHGSLRARHHALLSTKYDPQVYIRLTFQNYFDIIIKCHVMATWLFLGSVF